MVVAPLPGECPKDIDDWPIEFIFCTRLTGCWHAFTLTHDRIQCFFFHFCVCQWATKKRWKETYRLLVGEWAASLDDTIVTLIGWRTHGITIQTWRCWWLSWTWWWWRWNILIRSGWWRWWRWWLTNCAANFVVGHIALLKKMNGKKKLNLILILRLDNLIVFDQSSHSMEIEREPNVKHRGRASKTSDFMSYLISGLPNTERSNFVRSLWFRWYDILTHKIYFAGPRLIHGVSGDEWEIERWAIRSKWILSVCREQKSFAVFLRNHFQRHSNNLAACWHWDSVFSICQFIRKMKGK